MSNYFNPVKIIYTENWLNILKISQKLLSKKEFMLEDKYKSIAKKDSKKELKSAFGQLIGAVIVGSLMVGIYSYFIYYDSDSPTQTQQVAKKEKKKEKK